MPSELTQKIDLALKRIETFQRPEGLYLAFSGGKDSVTVKRLLDMAGAKYDAHYRVTSVDPPELVRFIRDRYGDVDREVPRDESGKPITMWNLIPRKLMPPTRLVRYSAYRLGARSQNSERIDFNVRLKNIKRFKFLKR